MSHPTSIPPLFATKKQKILSALSVPDEIYTDLSPKGSVDAGLKDLIHHINSLEGFVTTSSCAGRISVFYEGLKKQATERADEVQSFENDYNDDNDDDDEVGKVAGPKAVPGGKGLGGQWLFVSHDPVEIPEDTCNLYDLFGLGRPNSTSRFHGIEKGSLRRLVRFQFEPMILHVQTATLQHASLILAAALNAGFRESGLQSLKSLHDPNAFPMVAVRTAGLGLSSVIGFSDETTPPQSNANPTTTNDSNLNDGQCEGVERRPESIVDDRYLAQMLELGNLRFVENAERIERFRVELRKVMEREGRREKGREGWEDGEVRAQRLRREGLERRARIREEEGRQGSSRREEEMDDGDGRDDALELGLLPDG